MSHSPLSNFLPSGSISFTSKISSNSTPAILHISKWTRHFSELFTLQNGVKTAWNWVRGKLGNWIDEMVANLSTFKLKLPDKLAKTVSICWEIHVCHSSLNFGKELRFRNWRVLKALYARGQHQPSTCFPATGIIIIIALGSWDKPCQFPYMANWLATSIGPWIGQL